MSQPRLELVLRWIVFERKHEPGNFIVVDPTLDPVLALGATGLRPTVYVARDRHSIQLAAEALLHELELSAIDTAGLRLVERVRDGMARANGYRKGTVQHGRLRPAA